MYHHIITNPLSTQNRNVPPSAMTFLTDILSSAATRNNPAADTAGTGPLGLGPVSTETKCTNSSQTCLVPSPMPVGFPLSYQQGMGKRFQGRRKTKKEATRAMKSSTPYSRKKTDTLLKDVFLISSRNLSKVPRGKKRKQMYLDGLVASGVEFNINMNHEDVMRTIIDAFSIVPKIVSCLHAVHYLNSLKQLMKS